MSPAILMSCLIFFHHFSCLRNLRQASQSPLDAYSIRHSILQIISGEKLVYYDQFLRFYRWRVVHQNEYSPKGFSRQHRRNRFFSDILTLLPPPQLPAPALNNGSIRNRPTLFPCSSPINFSVYLTYHHLHKVFLIFINISNLFLSINSKKKKGCLYFSQNSSSQNFYIVLEFHVLCQSTLLL